MLSPHSHLDLSTSHSNYPLDEHSGHAFSTQSSGSLSLSLLLIHTIRWTNTVDMLSPHSHVALSTSHSNYPLDQRSGHAFSTQSYGSLYFSFKLSVGPTQWTCFLHTVIRLSLLLIQTIRWTNTVDMLSPHSHLAPSISHSNYPLDQHSGHAFSTQSSGSLHFSFKLSVGPTQWTCFIHTVIWLSLLLIQTIRWTNTVDMLSPHSHLALSTSHSNYPLDQHSGHAFSTQSSGSLYFSLKLSVGPTQWTCFLHTIIWLSLLLIQTIRWTNTVDMLSQHNHMALSTSHSNYPLDQRSGHAFSTQSSGSLNFSFKLSVGPTQWTCFLHTVIWLSPFLIQTIRWTNTVDVLSPHSHLALSISHSNYPLDQHSGHAFSTQSSGSLHFSFKLSVGPTQWTCFIHTVIWLSLLLIQTIRWTNTVDMLSPHSHLALSTSHSNYPLDQHSGHAFSTQSSGSLYFSLKLSVGPTQWTCFLHTIIWLSLLLIQTIRWTNTVDMLSPHNHMTLSTSHSNYSLDQRSGHAFSTQSSGSLNFSFKLSVGPTQWTCFLHTVIWLSPFLIQSIRWTNTVDVLSPHSHLALSISHPNYPLDQHSGHAFSTQSSGSLHFSFKLLHALHRSITVLIVIPPLPTQHVGLCVVDKRYKKRVLDKRYQTPALDKRYRTPVLDKRHQTPVLDRLYQTLHCHWISDIAATSDFHSKAMTIVTELSYGKY